VQFDVEGERVSAELDFGGRSVLVVGGSSGIGNGIAQAFRARAATVTVWGTRRAAADYEGVEGSDLAGLDYVCVDVGDPAGIRAGAARLASLDVLVLCQGTVVYQRGEFEEAGWDQVMSVNLRSLMLCAGAFREKLAAAHGALIIVSSISGLQANIGNPAYAASKAGAISLTKSLARAWAGDGVRVNGLAPGLVETKLTVVTTKNERRREASLASIPLRRFGEPADMAAVALFLASPLAAYVVGHTVVVDGGMTL
jgi:3-oxoacyl-[acyl-carrier protein] reductase